MALIYNDREHPNLQMVGARGDQVVVMLPMPVMSARQAVEHAAWLVAMAEILDPSLDFTRVLDAVRST